ncbi:Asp-tRNA(Asn)/Glu-tRNA(Gln) amidotransferase subunit GatB [Phaeocystidibacter marisrubri]|uniref:Aspartyl/glutamyl-tRNA(Asn/Gln) amidotransferase subunit B n=1 Tax=Phaeocystidibacter marisrubri TaxID=1577780 RepID=A0A6L3ZHG5_9FLAO|nr:Asp-tRNA(Asn)/Glu-tRNA(Gln) amidotransferase subunit GatB [Phaeocystidibacter marisrubri]KAB2817267.1 Asp-tRNA(Asn)/Glu-tRNA(Gln) amidotransferase subunit GatB [Phaeocystidibacter marisrubri]GGH76170.1 aspartyl/glutamyl-tRNA(Asn/Gln) amidotransferase subunit B [Phaeocystidibacter marisrubri]
MSASKMDAWEAIIGLEVHTQLSTKSKAYSSDATEYGAAPNSQVSPISLGHPGTLPVANKSVIEYAVRLGIACGCDIREWNEYARKNYFYADLPKGYQITQDKTPICTGGAVRIETTEGGEKFINLTRIHMEEDSGKSIHDLDPFHSLIDLNRAGVPLLEIVSEPDFRNGEEAYAYLNEIRKLVRYLDISDGNMEEGSLRCDVNVSVRKRGTEKFGTKVEVKNLNSFRNVQKSIDFEINRQIAAIEAGETIVQETRTFDASTGATAILRAKEDAHDYRYFPEPDLQPVVVTQDYVEKVKTTLPPLPRELYLKYTENLGLSDYDAKVLTEDKSVAMYFEECLAHTQNAKGASNWIQGPIKGWLNERAEVIENFPVPAATIAELIALVDDGKVSNTVANQKIFPLLLEKPDGKPEAIASENDWVQESDSNALQAHVDAALAQYPDKVEEYKNGKKGVLGLFMGEVMKLSQGKADPKVASQMLRETLEK